MRAGTHEHEKDSKKRLSISITVRQLEAVIRISESLAKMRLALFVTDANVNEALRLFQVSTLDAAMSGSLAGKRIYIISFHIKTKVTLTSAILHLRIFLRR